MPGKSGTNRTISHQARGQNFPPRQRLPGRCAGAAGKCAAADASRYCICEKPDILEPYAFERVFRSLPRADVMRMMAGRSLGLAAALTLVALSTASATEIAPH